MSFDASAPGTPAAHWEPALAAAPALRLDLGGLSGALVVAAHADDETLGAGGLIARLTAAAVPITVVAVTDGAASELDGGAALIARRSDELAEAVRILAPGATIVELGIPDGGAREHREEIAERLGALLPSSAEGWLVLAPWAGDGHRDHRVVGEISERLTAGTGAHLLAYPVWLWHWGDPAAGLGALERLEVVALSPGEAATKAAAIAAYRSQTEPRGTLPPMLRADVLAHFRRDREAYVIPVGGDASTRHFERLHHRAADPWNAENDWYERRKRDVLMASLPRERYGSVLEIGASVGHLTALLAERADHVTAVDVSDAAVARARERLAGRPHVTLEVADVRRGLPPGPFDAVVLSEVGYYLDGPELDELLDRIAAVLRPGGELVACHWRGKADDMPQSGARVHAALAERFAMRISHDDAAFSAGVFAVPA